MKRVLVTGENSYIGTSFVYYMKQYENEYSVDTISVRGKEWQKADFSVYDAIFHVAGIAHADVGSVSKEEQAKYYEINRDLSVAVADKYKEDRGKQDSQFIYMSSIIVYGDNVSIRKKRVITRETVPTPSNFYGDSKLQAEIELDKRKSDTFKLVILRPPMIYGPNSKGNYPQLRKIALKVPAFPDIPNERSMLFVDNLSSYVKTAIDKCEEGVHFPQNNEYVRTSHLVKEIGKAHGKNIKLFSFLNWGVYLLSYFPGKIGDLTNKAFGNLVYEENEVKQFVTFKDSVVATEVEVNK